MIKDKFVSTINDHFVSKYRDKTPPWGAVGYVTYKRTYARRMDDGQTEEWYQTVHRAVNGLLEIGAKLTKEEVEILYDKVFNLKCSFSGRALWQLGTKTVEKLGADSLQNCWCISIDDPVESFCFVFNELMLGGGVGFNIQREVVYEMSKVKYDVEVVRKDEKDVDYIVPDNREGWVDLLRRVLSAFFVTGKSFTYSTICVRGKGTLIKSFGGTASGPEDLCHGIDQIALVLGGRVGKKLRPIDCLDILNIIGSIVVAGNVRRSAQIGLGDMDDFQYLDAKNWAKGNIPNWRAMSNNSVICNQYAHLPEKFWSGYNGDGEAYGLVNLANCRKFGRLVDGPGYRADPRVVGVNPCGEITLESGESCNLAEIFLPRIDDEEEFRTIAELMCKATKTISCVPYIHDITNAVVGRNHRLGISVTGYLQASRFHDKDILGRVYRHVEKTDKEYSKIMGVKPSIKLTTVKPSGCMKRDTLVSTSIGLLRLDELGDIGGHQWQPINGVDVHTDNGSRQALKFYVNGRAKTKKIITEDGVVLEATLAHRYRVLGAAGEYSWKRVGDIRIGDRLVVRLGTQPDVIKTPLVKIKQSTATQIMTQPDELDTDTAYFLGLFYADGSVHENDIRISFNRKQPGLIRWLSDFMQSRFGLRSYTGSGDNVGFYVNSQNFLAWLEANGVKKGYYEEISLPLLIRKASKKNAIAFIDGFWRGDGDMTTWTVCSVSECFAREMQALCRAVGLNVKIASTGPGGLGARDRWILQNRSMDEAKARYRSKSMRERSWNGFWLDPVAAIEESECDTYDLEVDRDHNYLANGVVSHNTLSLLPGCTPGVHPAYAPFYVRRIRMASSDSLVALCQRNGFPVEPVMNFDGSHDRNTMVVSFPVQTPEGTICAKDLTAVQQLDHHRFLQSHWADNSVSVTVYYRKEELPEIQAWLRENYDSTVKTVSFLLHSEHGFQQAPYEEISEEEFKALSARTTPITRIDGDRGGDMDAGACSTGACPIR